jgi:hypothetical protein
LTRPPSTIGVGDAEAGDELGLLAHLREQAGELHAAAVDQRDLVAVLGQHGDGLGDPLQQRRVFQGDATDFDYELHGTSKR